MAATAAAGVVDWLAAAAAAAAAAGAVDWLAAAAVAIGAAATTTAVGTEEAGCSEQVYPSQRSCLLVLEHYR
jgi:hypothetical protein